MPVFAAVDIGANSVRLKIARLVRRRLTVVNEDREVTRLGGQVFSTGLLAPQAIAQTVKALSRFHRACQEHGADAVRVVATSALRDARNARAFTDWVRAATGWRVEIISGLEEGRLIHLGLVSHVRVARGRVLMADLGGGSCELTVSEGGHIREMFSLPLGAVRLTHEFLAHDPPKKKELARLREYVGEQLERVSPRILAARLPLLLGTSGTVAALTGRAAALTGRRGPVSRRTVSGIAASLQKMDTAARAALPGIGPRRAEIIVSGAIVFAELMERCHLSTLRYSPLGLRDGLLAQMAADQDRSPALRQHIEAERSDALQAVGRQYRVDVAHAQHVRLLALQLFQGLRTIHHLPAEYAEWIGTAALLHEVGSFLNRAGRHRHSYYIIAHSEILGFSIAERRLIAAIARYQGKSRPTPLDRISRTLPEADRLHLGKAVILLRLARALNQGRRGAVTTIRTRVHADRVILRLVTKWSGAELELWAFAKERGYFREVFGRDLSAVPAP